ncbi:MAG: hypothetical protein IRZ07_30720, partial [Microbispora sp.]|nr:hypothetical protein [Microbispora sp.]
MTEITLAQAVAEVDRLQAAAEKWAAAEVTQTAELEAFEASAAARLVDDPGAAEQLTDEAARLRAGLALTRRTREAAEEQLVEARRGVLRARAAELRAEAADRRAEAEGLEAKAAPLLEQLRALMGCPYGPAVSYGPSGV